eukprot:11944970-Prorocentrum_lima.AAC.1
MTQDEWWQTVQETRNGMAERHCPERTAPTMGAASDDLTSAQQQPAQETLSDEDSTDAEDLAQPLDPKAAAAAKP